MPSDSPLQAVVEYCRAQSVGGSAVKAYRDTAPAEEGGVRVVPPYVVVVDQGGSVERDMEGNEFGPQAMTLTVYAGTPELARQIFDRVVYASQNPDLRQGIERPGILLAYLTGFSTAEVQMDRRPQEGRARSRFVSDLQHTMFVRLQVFTTRS